MTEGPTLRVVSYNVHGLRGDLDELAGVVRRLEPDVLIAQEAPRRFRWRAQCARLARRTGLLYGGGGLPSLGNLVLTGLRVRVRQTWPLRYPLTPGRHLRGAVFAECELGRVPFALVGSHLATDPAERPAQAQLLKKALADLNVPLIFAGDLNESPDGTAWRLLAEGLTDAASAGSGATGHPSGGSSAGTFPAASPAARIDTILVDPRITVTAYRVDDSAEARRASDHLPVLADLLLPAPVESRPAG